MTKEEIEYCIRLVDLALVQCGNSHALDTRNTLRSLRRVLAGPEIPQLLRRKPDGGPDDGSNTGNSA